jgi:hypothetical protein
VKRSQPGGSQAQGRYVSSSVLKTKVAPLQGLDAKNPFQGSRRLCGQRNSAYRSPLETLQRHYFSDEKLRFLRPAGIRLVVLPRRPSGHIKLHNGKFNGFAVLLWPLTRERINSHPRRDPLLLQRASNRPNRVVPNSHKSMTSRRRTKLRSRQHGACLHNMMSKLTKTRKRVSYARKT